MQGRALLLGRDEEMALLQRYLQRAVTREQQLVVLEGDPGIGKTALLKAFAESQGRRLRGPRVLFLQAPERERYDPVHHAALAATSQRIYQHLGGERQATEAARDLMPDWLGVIPVWGNLIAAVVATLKALDRRRQRENRRAPATVDEEVQALLRAARKRPLVLLLDDLERADREAIARLEALVVTADIGARILVVGAYRPTPPGVADPPIHALLRRLPQEQETYTRRRLQPLSSEAVEALLRGRFQGAAIPERFVDWLHGATGGHPATLEATLAHLQAHLAIRRTAGGWQITADPDRLHLPPVRHDFADLDAVDPRTVEVVQAASVLGTEFDAAAVARLLKRDELEVEDRLALGVHAGLVETRGEITLPDGDLTTRYRFAAPHLRAALLQGLPRERRTAWEAALTAAQP